jgi:hypothetical protein
MLDAIRLGPADAATAVTAAQLRDVFTRLLRAGQWKVGDPDILIVMDAGYDVTRLAHATPPATARQKPSPGTGCTPV